MKSDIYSNLLHVKGSYSAAKPSVTPIFQCSGYEVNSSVFYGRKSSPNTEELEDIFRKIDYAEYALMVNSGMSAIFMCLNLLKPNSSILLSSKIYGCTYKLFEQYCEQHSIKLDILDLSKLESLLINNIYDLCFFETPTNPFLSTIDIEKVSRLCKAKNEKCIIVVDNTWATPLFQNPLNHGADIAVYSASKYFSGHSDIIAGVITLNDDSLFNQLSDLRFYGGLFLQPFSAWLLRRSLQTFELRLNHQKLTTKFMISALKEKSWIKKIYEPNIDGVQLRDYGGIIFVEITEAALKNFESKSKDFNFFGTGTGMACVTSMIAQPYYGSHASLGDEEKEAMGITSRLIRLCFGLEDPKLLLFELEEIFGC